MSKIGLTHNPEYDYRIAPYGLSLSADDLISALPPALSAEQMQRIIGASYKVDSKPYFEATTTATYRYHDMDFLVPPGVLYPGESSGFIFDKIWLEEISLRDRAYLAMGVGAGVELVLAALRGAARIVGSDIDAESVRVSQQNVAKNLSIGTEKISTITSDLYDSIPKQKFDIITFNAPVGLLAVNDPVLMRMAYSGPQIMDRFFQQTVQHGFLANDGAIFSICSNTTDIRAIVGFADTHGFHCDVLETIEPSPTHRYAGVVSHYLKFVLR